MRAVRVDAFGGPEVLRVAAIEAPRVDERTHVLVRVACAGLNPVDTYIRAGTYAGAPPPPYTPGKDCAGVVVAHGAGVAHVRVGERVWVCGTLTGAYAELALCDADAVFPLPERLSFAQGAAIGTAALTAYRALFTRGRARPGEGVLVHGASGGVGLAAVALAAAHGCVVVGSAGSAEGAAAVREAGAAHAIDHSAWKGSAQPAEPPIALPAGVRVQLVVEMLASSHLQRAADVLEPEGRVVVVGSRGALPSFAPRVLMAKELTLSGVMLGRATAAERREAAAHVGAALRAGTLAPRVAREYALDDAPRAHADVLAQPGGSAGKLVLRVQADDALALAGAG